MSSWGLGPELLRAGVMLQTNACVSVVREGHVMEEKVLLKYLLCDRIEKDSQYRTQQWPLLKELSSLRKSGGGRWCCSLSTLLLLLLSSCWVVSDSLRPQGGQSTRPPCLSPSPGLCSDSCPLSQWCQPPTSSSVAPFSSEDLACLKKLWRNLSNREWMDWGFQMAVLTRGKPAAARPCAGPHQPSSWYLPSLLWTSTSNSCR